MNLCFHNWHIEPNIDEIDLFFLLLIFNDLLGARWGNLMLNIRHLFEVFWGLADELGRVKSHLEEVSFLAEFCSQVKFVLVSNYQ